MHDPLQVEFTQHDSHQDSLFHYNEVDMKESPTLQGIDSGGASSKDDPPVEPVSTAATLSVQPSNESIQQLAPFFELGTRIFPGYLQWSIKTAIICPYSARQNSPRN